MLYTKNQFKISFSIPGVSLDNKSWDKFSGGSHKAETGTYNPGGMAPAVAHGGATKRNTATLERAWDDTLIGAFLSIDNATNGPCSVRVTPLKNSNTTASAGFSYTGIISEVVPPDEDSTSSDVQMLQVVIELNEPITN